MEEKRALNVLIPKQAHRELRLLSAHREVPMTKLIRQALEDFLAKEHAEDAEKQGAA